GDGGSGGGGGGGGGRGGSGGGGFHGATAPPHSPVTTDDGLAELPDLPPGGDRSDRPGPDSPSSQDNSQDRGLADLPSLEPGEDGASRTTQVAARENTPTSMVTPAVLVLFLMLMLLFSMPLAPSRRVRIGPTAYRGRRRKH
ncbi:hypothetical protein ACFQZU_10355, partial [Streptomonospora algeriensis]